MTTVLPPTPPLPLPDHAGGLKFVQGDRRWQTLRERCRDLFWFNSVVLGYTTFMPYDADTHALLCRFISRQTGIPDLDEVPFQQVEMPRGTGKSITGTIGYAIQLACFNPNISIMIANERQET